MGVGALSANTTASSNTGIGHTALEANTTGASNTALGASALKNNTTADNNTALGSAVLDACTTGSHNTGAGRLALSALTTGIQNVAIGKDALLAVTTGQNNTAVGKGSLVLVSGGTSGNTGIGEASGFSVTTGGQNTFLGKACQGPTTASRSIIIGADLGDRGNTSNMVVIGTGSAVASFSGSATSWTFSSDGRDKTDIVDLPLGLDFVNKLRPRKFKWNYRDKTRFPIESAKNPDMLIRSGFIAQEVQELLRQENADYTKLVGDEKPDQLTVGMTDMIPMLVNAIKELSAKVTALEAG
jgi:hypothetical protein